MVFRDDYSRYVWIYFLAKKSDASRALERFLSDTRPVGSVEIIRMDGGTEWKGEFERICDQERIRREVVPPSSAQYNGCAERGIAILEATAFAERRQAKNIYWAAREKIPVDGGVQLVVLCAEHDRDDRESGEIESVWDVAWKASVIHSAAVPLPRNVSREA